MSARQFTEQDIHLALDGELPEDDRAAYEAWLSANPDMKARAGRFADDGALLRAAIGDVVDEPVPERLTRKVQARAYANVSPRRIGWRVAVAAALVAAGLAGGYVIGSSGWLRLSPQTLQLADSAIAAHNIYSAEKLHVVEVGVDQKDHLQKWLSKRLDLTLVAPDLTTEGFHLIGGRLLPAGEKSAAQFMYEDSAGSRISLYVARDSSDRETGFRFAQEGATRAVFWLDEGYGCAIAGAASEQILSRIADIAYRQLLTGIAS